MDTTAIIAIVLLVVVLILDHFFFMPWFNPAVKAERERRKNPAAARQDTQSIENRLRKLDDLRARGLITEQEHRDRRLAILKEI